MTAESMFTEPHEDCPHPDRWQAIDSEATEFEVTELVSTFVHALHPRLVIETGTYTAQTAVAIASMLDAGAELHTFETNEDRQRDAAARLLPWRHVHAHLGPLQGWTPPAPVDFAWIDSGDADVRHAEIEWLASHAHRRTVVGVHDARYQSVKGMLRDLCECRIITFPLFLPTPRGVAFFRYNAAAVGS